MVRHLPRPLDVRSDNISQQVLIKNSNHAENPVADPLLSYGVCQATENRVSSFSSF
jgi:hypothetical protein